MKYKITQIHGYILDINMFLTLRLILQEMPLDVAPYQQIDQNYSSLGIIVVPSTLIKYTSNLKTVFMTVTQHSLAKTLAL